MTTINNFFNTILTGNNAQENAVEILRARGFLIDRTPDGWEISDNSHCLDGKGLDAVLRKYNCGFLEGNRIIFPENVDYQKLLSLFTGNTRVGYETCWWITQDWRDLRRRIHGYKIKVMDLEPYIARYVKAISACGVLTIMSCDGSHCPGRPMFIGLSDLSNVVWHRLICEQLLQNFDIPWQQNNTEIPFKGGRYWIYSQVNKAAELLYANRILCRDIKQLALRDFNAALNLPYADVRSRFTYEVNRLFRERANEIVSL